MTQFFVKNKFHVGLEGSSFLDAHCVASKPWKTTIWLKVRLSSCPVCLCVLKHVLEMVLTARLLESTIVKRETA